MFYDCVFMLSLQVLFSKAAETKIRQLTKELDERRKAAAKMLENVIDLFNQVRAGGWRALGYFTIVHKVDRIVCCIKK